MEFASPHPFEDEGSGGAVSLSSSSPPGERADGSQSVPLLAEGDLRLSAVTVDIDPETGRATGIERIQKSGEG